MQPNVLLQRDFYLRPAVKGLALEIAYLIPRVCIKVFTALYTNDFIYLVLRKRQKSKKLYVCM